MSNNTKFEHGAVKKFPQVSIGMPVYNGEKYISEALDSLLAQTFTDFELIISDNASTDGTEATCRKFMAMDARIRYVRQAKNRGAVTNFKFVLDEAAGEYFMWAAADDLWAPNFIENCQRALESNKYAGMAMTAYMCTSRLSGLFNRTFDNPLVCITFDDSKDRVRSYSMLPLSTHKDNLVYSIWRKKCLKEILIALDSIGKPNLIGAAMNEYALALFKGQYVQDVSFYKRYRYLPPGHLFDPVFRSLSLLKRRIFSRSSYNESASGVSVYLSDLKVVLKKAGFTDDFVSEIVELNKLHLNRNNN